MRRVIGDAQDAVAKAAREIDGAEGDAKDFMRIYDKNYNEKDATATFDMVAGKLKVCYNNAIDMEEKLARLMNELRR